MISSRERDLNPILIFTDGAEEEDEEHDDGRTYASVGGIFLDPECDDRGPKKRFKNLSLERAPRRGRHCFGGRVPQHIVERWRRIGGHTKVIHQAEILPAVIAVDQWGAQARDRRVILFVDNEAARAALIKGVSSSRPSAELVGWFWQSCAEHCIHIWIERVPSKSNPADGPSRDDFGWCHAEGFERAFPECLGEEGMGENKPKASDQDSYQ